MPAWLVVRAVVADPADRAAFDDWYRTEHLPDALKAFAARSAMARLEQQRPVRALRVLSVRQLGGVRKRQQRRAIQALIAEFDRRWGLA